MAKVYGGLGLKDLLDVTKRNDCKAIEEILKKFPSESDYTCRGVSPLHEASYHGHVDAMKTLIRLGADIDMPDFHNEWTPLHYAVEGNQPLAVQLLLRSGARENETNLEGLTARQVAYRKKLKKCIGEFISHDPTIAFKVDETKINPTSDAQPATLQEELSPAIHVSEEAEERKMAQVTDRCVFCSERRAIVSFLPCHHKYACCECSVGRDVCFCNEPIEQRTIEDDQHARDYMNDMKRCRTGYGRYQRQVEDLEKRLKEAKEIIVCTICRDNPIDCALVGCGHVFCITCILQFKNRSTPDGYHKPYICPCCSKCSRYRKLFPPWHTGERRHVYGTNNTDFQSNASRNRE